MSIINKEEEEPVADNNTTAKDAQEEKMTQQNNKKEKRKSDRQLTKDRASEDEEEVPADGGVFERADDAVLKTRKIARVKRRSQDPTSQQSLQTTAGGTTTNPFASVTLSVTAPAASSQEKKVPVPQGGGFGSLAAKGATGGGLAFGTSSSLGFGSLAKNDQNGGLLFGKTDPTTKSVGDNKDASNTDAQKEEQEQPQQPATHNNNPPSDSIFTSNKNKSVFGQPQQEMTDEAEETRTTGEEGEETLHATNVSLFEFQGGQWKERGKGLLKVNKNKETQACRLIMRQQGNLKLLLNANVWKGMKVSTMEESKGMSFSCINHLDDANANSSKNDTSADQSALGLFAIRSRDATAMKEIYKTITAAIDTL